ncbi:hypothetical protein GDO78_020924 [Eleutherodactylus coqui]|uniref:Olfactory receptor n=1 Tax=Eleutherodactylus coqui TaxID=57060 RepID=A0A8J6JTC5_ELECQ|nr:hypothetical protein GDO78_020924 [Eleutherodactylus coqui]
MDYGNQTLLTEMILVGFTQNFQDCILLFVLFFIMYILTILGNSFLIFTIIVSPQLHTPMYYFLCNLSSIDLGYTSSSIPKILLDLFSKTRSISITGCLTQMNFTLFLGTTECILLALMAYDRYIAICFPLYYTVIMSWRVCNLITVIMWSISFIVTLTLNIINPFVFCRRNKLDHVSCEILAVLELACGDLSTTKLLMFVVSFFTIISPLVFIVVSYVCIIISILKISSVGGRSKAFSTCASHLTVVLMFYGTSMIMYMGQARFSSYLKYISLIYGVGTPVLNPFIYSLRNNDVKEAFKKILTKCSVM